MKYKIQAIQTIYKYFEVEGDNKDDALAMAQTMAEEGAVRFDDEPYSKMEIDINVL